MNERNGIKVITWASFLILLFTFISNGFSNESFKTALLAGGFVFLNFFIVVKVAFYILKDSPNKGACESCHLVTALSQLDYIDPEKGFKKILKHKSKKFCREHFMYEYKKAFLGQTSKTLVMNPCFRNNTGGYIFVAFSDFPEFGFDEEDIAVFSKIIENIPAEKECAYIDSCQIETNDMYSTKPKYLGDMPVEYLSKEEAWKRVEDGFKKHQNDFEEAFSSAYRDEKGVYMDIYI